MTAARAWIDELANVLQTAPPSDAEIEDLLALASVAAHASERVAAPVACWLAARAGRTPSEALAAANGLVASAEREAGAGGGPAGA